jgi:RNA polymerase sigma-70 factor (ECF subfamily)
MLLMHTAAAPTSRESDRSAVDFETAVAPLLEPCFRLALVMLSDAGEAEDAVQEAVTKAWRHLDQLREGAELRPWLLGIVANECRMTRRRRWWRVVRLAEPPRTAEALPAEELDGAELRRAIGRLPRQLALVITLRYYLDLSLEDVAATAGIPLGTAKSRLHRATRELRRELGSWEEVTAA